jgi:hypothetical protein
MRSGKTTILLMAAFVMLLAVPVRSESKQARIWASVQFNKRTVVVGEPLLVTITVYTSTWFTGSPQFGEIQVPQAIMVVYQQRTGAMRKTIGNKSYPAIEKKYVVYPLKEGENSLPSLSIVVESPDEGDYKGKRRSIKSPERTFSVLPPPEGISTANWLAAYNVQLSEQWSRRPEQLLQGDVLDRRITIQAYGALAALIPPLDIPEATFGNIYGKAPQLSNVQNEGSFTGTRTETWTYLMESEGSFILPGIRISWYDPQSQRAESAEIPSREISVAENPDLDFLLSMQDSLQAMLAMGEPEEEKVPFEWRGLNWWQLSVILISFVVLCYLGVRVFRRVSSGIRKRREQAFESEEYFFSILQKTGNEADPALLMRALLQWYDRYREGSMGPDFQELVCSADDPELKSHYDQLLSILYSEESDQAWSGQPLVTSLNLLRKQKTPESKAHKVSHLMPLNPENNEKQSCQILTAE